MLSAGLDFHKRYSQDEVIDEGGLRRASARLSNEFGMDWGQSFGMGVISRIAVACRLPF